MSTSRLVRVSAVVGAGVLLVLGVPGTAAAQAPPELSQADTAWMLVATALVLLMTPALAFFYGGMVRGKNVLWTMLQSIVALALVSVTWLLWGYSLGFGPDRGGSSEVFDAARVRERLGGIAGDRELSRFIL